MNKKKRHYRLFTDGSYDMKRQIGGISCVLYHGSNSQPVFFIRKEVICKDPQEAEYMALEYGLRLVKKKGIRSIAAFCDAQVVVHQVNNLMISKNKNCATIAELLHEVDGYLTWIPREENKVADALSSLSDTRFSSWEHQNILKAFCLK